MKKEYVQDIADRLIEQIKSNTAPWQKPWEAGQSIEGLPINLNTGKPYRGMNLVNLMSVAENKGYEDNRWITYKGAEKLGAQVKKGEKSTSIHYWKFYEEQVLKDEDNKPILDKDGKQITVQVKLDNPRVFFANVFNAEQIDGLPPKEQIIKPIAEWERHKRAEEILEASGVSIRHKPGDAAYYRPSIDEITLPKREQFQTGDRYYATALHELGHATGHPSRLNRDLSGGFGSENYAKEELRAELASLFIGQELQIGHDPGQHIAYLKSWVKVLEDDPKEIFRAARDADLISSFLLDLSQEQKIENTQTSDQNIEEIKQVFLMRQQNQELDQSVKALNRVGKKSGFSLALQPNGDSLKATFVKGNDAIDPYLLVQKDGSMGLIKNIDSPMIMYSKPEAITAVIGAISPFREAVTVLEGAKRFIAKVQDEEEKLQIDSFTNNFKSLNDALEKQFKDHDVSALIELEKVGNLESLKVSYIGKDSDLHHYSTNISEKGFLSIAYNGVNVPSTNTGSVKTHLNDITDASLGYVDLVYNGKNHTEEVVSKLKLYKENALGDSPYTTWTTLSTVAKESGVFARISENIVPPALSEEERQQQPKFIINYLDQDKINLDVNTLVFENGKAVTLQKNEEYEAINVTSDPLTQSKILLTHINSELTMNIKNQNSEKVYIDVGFGDKEEAKQLGAKWDGKAKAWYVPAGADLTPFEKWDVIKPEQSKSEESSKVLGKRNYIKVPIEEKDEAKKLGAKWDRVQKSWYVPNGIDTKLFDKWMDNKEISTPAAKVDALAPMTLSFLQNITKGQDYEHVGYTVLYAANKAKDLSSDEEIEKLGQHIKTVIETGKGLSDPENQYIFDAVSKLKNDNGFDDWLEFEQSREEPQLDLSNIAPAMKDHIKNVEQQEEVLEQTEKTYLAVPYQEKDEAKQLGAMFDSEVKAWYVPAGINPEPLEKWLPHNQNHLDLPDTSKSISPEEEFKAALMEAGLVVHGNPIMDGKMQRVPVQGDKGSQLGGAYKGYLDGRPAGYIRNFRTGLEEKWKSNSSTFNVVDTARMRAESAQKRANEAKRLELLYEKTADQAAMLYAVADLAHEHPYLQGKGITNNGLIKVVPDPKDLPVGCEIKIAQTWQEAKAWRDQNKENGITETILTKGDLLVPGFNADGKLMMVQTINGTGFKGYMKDSKKSGSFALFGDLQNGKPFLIAEGIATAATLHEQTKQPVVAAFDSGNLAVVARELRDKYMESRIYLAADNDHIAEAKNRASGKKGILNPGAEFALQAANEIQGYVLTPKFAKDDPGTDWNDVFKTQGPGEFKQQIQAELAKAKSLEQTAKVAEVKLFAHQNEISKKKDDQKTLEKQQEQRDAMKLKR
ncbi:DUF5710 domain-containing protein [Acinetobacter johnsonii]|uniref:DUF5710 domain-containing protein n=1 Tax=Acinetobacter johnsonii TaxID=40214 RepID=UPI0030A9C810